MAWIVDEVAKSGPGVGLTTGSQGQPTPYLNIGGDGTGEGAGMAAAPGKGWVVDQPAPAAIPPVLSDFGRQLGLTGRAAMTGAMAIPTAIGDAANAALNLIPMGINRVAGIDLPTLRMPSEALQSGMTQLGVPVPKNLQERAVQAGGAALTGAGAMGLLARAAASLPAIPRQIADLLSQAPLVQTLGAASAAAATDYAKQQGVKNPLALTGIALGTSLLPGAAGATTLSRAGGALKSIGIDPFTAAGREIIAGKVLNRLATTPEATSLRMAVSEPVVPGSRPTIAQVSQDPGLIAAEKGIRAALDTGVGSSGRIAERYSEQNAARNALLDRIIPTAETRAAMEAKRNAAVDQQLAPAFRANQNMRDIGQELGMPLQAELKPVFDRIAEIRQSPSGKRQGIREAMNEAERLMTQPDVDIGDARVLYEIRKDMMLLRDGKLKVANDSNRSDLKVAKGQVASIMARLDDAIDAIAPGYRRYIDLYPKRSVPLNQQEQLVRLRTKGTVTASDPITREPILGNGKFQTAVQTAIARGALKDRIGPPGGQPRIPFHVSGKRQYSAMLTDSQLRTIQRVAEDLDRGAAMTANTMKVPGSDTFQNFSVANVIGRVIGDAHGAGTGPGHAGIPKAWGGALFHWLYNSPDTVIQQILVDAVLDPHFAARLMRNATRHEVEGVARELARRAAQVSEGATIYTGANTP